MSDQDAFNEQILLAQENILLSVQLLMERVGALESMVDALRLKVSQ